VNWYNLAADTLLVFHLGYVLFTVGGFAAILLGGVRRWRWVRNFVFRLAHLAAVVLVAVEALLGVLCPLTAWEYSLRLAGGRTDGAAVSLVARIVQRVIFYDLPDWVFLVMYIAFAAAVLLTFLLVPPNLPGSSVDANAEL